MSRISEDIEAGETDPSAKEEKMEVIKKLREQEKIRKMKETEQLLKEKLMKLREIDDAWIRVNQKHLHDAEKMREAATFVNNHILGAGD